MKNATIEVAAQGGTKRKVILIAAVLALLAVAGGGVFWKRHHEAGSRSAVVQKAPKLVLVTIPTLVSNLDSDEGRTRYVRISARLQVEDSKNMATLEQSMPEIQNAFQTCLHGLRPEELTGAGIYRLRETMLTQIQNMLAPLQVRDLFLVEVLVQ